MNINLIASTIPSFYIFLLGNIQRVDRILQNVLQDDMGSVVRRLKDLNYEIVSLPSWSKGSEVSL